MQTLVFHADGAPQCGRVSNTRQGTASLVYRREMNAESRTAAA